MSSKNCERRFPFISPEDVFDIATLTDNFPDGYGFIVKTESVRINENSKLNIGIHVAKRDLVIEECEVVDFEPNERVLIKGKNHLGNLAVSIKLRPNNDIDGTDILYGVDLTHTILSRWAQPLVQHKLDHSLGRYVEAYAQNINDMHQLRKNLLPQLLG